MKNTETHRSLDAIRNDIDRLYDEYWRACKAYTSDSADAYDTPEEALAYLNSTAYSNRSTTSGGHSVTNMIEAVHRELASRMAYSLSNRLANDARKRNRA